MADERRNGNSTRKDMEQLAAMTAGLLVVVIMANAIDGYFEAVLRYFQRLVPNELAYIATLATYALGAGIAYKLFKVVLVAILLGSVVNMGRGGSPLGVLGF